MTVSRRELLARLAGLGMLVAGGAVLKRILLPSRLDREGLRTFEACLDTLLPGGDGFPSWRETGVMPRLADELSEERQTRRALSEGTSWLDAEARRRYARSFVTATASERSAVLAGAEASPIGSIPRFFYRVVRDRAMQLHYAHPTAWRRAGLAHAPQPDGYWSYEDAPAS